MLEGITPSEVKVSTHSRAEAAAILGDLVIFIVVCFNTQPRGGGCDDKVRDYCLTKKFQHTAARRRLRHGHYLLVQSLLFQHTAARRRLLPT